MITTEPIPFRLHLMLAIQRAQRSGHLAFAGTLVGMLRQEIGLPASKPARTEGK